jgi:RNA polymerase sigma-70 factor (ECF subfamily)
MIEYNLHSDEDESQLIEKLRNGDKPSFEKIYGLYREKLYHFAYLHLKDQALAEDALQEIFLKLWLKRADLNSNLSIKGFLFTSLKNHLLNAIRTKKNEILKNIRIANRSEQSANVTENTIILSEYTQLATEGVEKLSRQKKEIFKLSVDQGLSNEEIAHNLGLSPHTIRFQISQSIKFLKKFLKKY